MQQYSYSPTVIVQLCSTLTEAGGYLRLQVHGQSMYPVIHNGDFVLLGSVSMKHIVGSIVLAWVGDQLVLHRVLYRSGHRLLLAGDACQKKDGWIKDDCVIAMVYQIERSCTNNYSHWRRCRDLFCAYLKHIKRLFL